MGHFCKTCRFLVADRGKQTASCHFWPEFAETIKRPWGGAWQPAFAPSAISPRHVWNDLPTPPDLAALGHDFRAEDWTETMDCATWEPSP